MPQSFVCSFLGWGYDHHLPIRSILWLAIYIVRGKEGADSAWRAFHTKSVLLTPVMKAVNFLDQVTGNSEICNFRQSKC